MMLRQLCVLASLLVAVNCYAVDVSSFIEGISPPACTPPKTDSALGGLLNSLVSQLTDAVAAADPAMAWLPFAANKLSPLFASDMWPQQKKYIECEIDYKLLQAEQKALDAILGGIQDRLKDISYLDQKKQRQQYINKIDQLFSYITGEARLFTNRQNAWASVEHFQQLVTAHLTLGAELVAMRGQKSDLDIFNSHYKTYTDYNSYAVPSTVNWRSAMINVTYHCTAHPPGSNKQGCCWLTDSYTDGKLQTKCEFKQNACAKPTDCQSYKDAVVKRLQSALTPPLSQWQKVYTQVNKFKTH